MLPYTNALVLNSTLQLWTILQDLYEMVTTLEHLVTPIQTCDGRILGSCLLQEGDPQSYVFFQ